MAIHYQRKGVIDAIAFTPRGKIVELHPTLEADLIECTEMALATFQSPNEWTFTAEVMATPDLQLGPYASSRCWISPTSNGRNQVALTVRAFDSFDGSHEFSTWLPVVLDVLAASTNCSFTRQSARTSSSRLSPETPSEFWKDDEWLDGQPLLGGFLRVSAEQIEYVDAIVDGSIERDSNLLRAAHQFHEALTLHRTDGDQSGELTTSLLMSALEVVSLPDDGGSPVCECCGQAIHRISHRVVGLGVKHLGPALERIFKDHYDRRSRYLHAGRVHARQPLTSHLIPQLDPSAPEGCAMPRVVGRPDNLVEFTSFIIRAELRRAARNLPATEI